MYIIQLPLTRGMRVAAAVFFAFNALIVLLTPVVWAGRLSVLVLLGGVAVWQWRRYRHWRPYAISIKDRRTIVCACRAARDIEITDVRRGVVSPAFISARLSGDAGEQLDLLVLPGSLSTDDHWRLRRALLAWRPASSDSDDAQSALRRGI